MEIDNVETAESQDPDVLTQIEDVAHRKQNGRALRSDPS
jgi:hypothetical protein